MTLDKAVDDARSQLLRTTLALTRELARSALDEAIRRADQLDCRASICVVDAAGIPISFERMDDSPLQCVRLCQDKAYSSAANGFAGDEFWHLIQGDEWLVSGAPTIRGLNWLGGGIPIRHDGITLGAVGVSSDHGLAEDIAIARAAIEVIAAALPS